MRDLSSEVNPSRQKASQASVPSLLASHALCGEGPWGTTGQGCTPGEPHAGGVVPGDSRQGPSNGSAPVTSVPATALPRALRGFCRMAGRPAFAQHHALRGGQPCTCTCSAVTEGPDEAHAGPLSRPLSLSRLPERGQSPSAKPRREASPWPPSEADTRLLFHFTDETGPLAPREELNSPSHVPTHAFCQHGEPYAQPGPPGSALLRRSYEALALGSTLHTDNRSWAPTCPHGLSR